jgi:hypothetical protein
MNAHPALENAQYSDKLVSAGITHEFPTHVLADPRTLKNQ